MTEPTDRQIAQVCQTIRDIEWLLSHDEITLGHTPSVWRQIVSSMKAVVTAVQPNALAVHDLGGDGPASDVFAQPSMLEDEDGQG